MADKKPTLPPAETQDLTTWLFGFIFVVIILGALAAQFQGIFGFLSGSGETTSFRDMGRQVWRSVTGEIAVNSIVRAVVDTSVFETLNDVGEQGRHQVKNAIGRVLDGPRFSEGRQWWFVDFESGADGWVDGDSIRPHGGIISRTIRLVVLSMKWIAGSIVIASLFGIIYAQRGLGQLRAKQKEYLSRIDRELIDTRPVNARWEKILTQSTSMNPADWRLAIIDADAMLDDLVTSMGYRGNSLGERLKVVEISDFTTLEKAWEAHKIRNRIAHSGSDFILTQREASRVIDLYRQVFEEFSYL
jgi:hypothetical protein